MTELEVVGEATTGEEAITLAAALQPDVVLMDLQPQALRELGPVVVVRGSRGPSSGDRDHGPAV